MIKSAIFLLIALALPAWAQITLPPLHIEQAGQLPAGAETAGRVVLANEPDGVRASIVVEFDLASVAQDKTPMARLHLTHVEKVKVKHAAEKATAERGVLHVFSREGRQPVGVLPVKAGGYVNDYLIDVTAAVNGALVRQGADRKVRLEVRLEGKPIFYEVYGAPMAQLALEIAPVPAWTAPWTRNVRPISEGPEVFREPALALTEQRDREVIVPLLYPAKKITEVIRNDTGERLAEGRDWMLRDGRAVLPPGSHAPTQLASEFFTVERKNAAGDVTTSPTSVKLMAGPWYHQRQMEISYEPASRDWTFPKPISSLANLPRLQKLLAGRAPLQIVLFGDSIAAGGDCSKLNGCPPYQPSFGELVTLELERRSGSPITS